MSINENSRKKEFQLFKEAESLMLRENHLYQAKVKKDKTLDFSWIKSVLSKGTLSDKIAANVLLVQDSAIPNLRSLEFLVELVNPKAKRESFMAMNSLKELFLGNLLKKDNLRTFKEYIEDSNYDEQDPDKKNEILKEAFFEDKLKQLYFKFIQNVEFYTHDPDLKNKKTAILVLYELLINNCEQEQFLLEKIVNKLGDLDSKNATNVVHLLEKLVNEHHPAMKEVVVKEVERVLYRTNVSYSAQYNALNFLSLIVFLRSEHDLANLVMKIYLSFFKLCLKKEKVNNKMMAILLTGISRAFPYCNLENNFLEEKIDTIYKLIHHVNFNISIQAYNLILKIITKDNSDFLTDRYCTSIYKSLMHPSIDECSKKATFLNVLYKTLKNDSILKRNLSFIRRIFQISLQNPSNLVCGLLILISSLFKEKKDLFNEFYNKVLGSIDSNTFKDDDEEEHYLDIENEEDDLHEDSENDSKSTVDLNEQKKNKPSWDFKKVNSNDKQQLSYDPLHRNPLYSNAETSHPYELLNLKNHYHPSVVLFTKKILSKEAIDYDGDVLYDFNVKSFLDKFVYKNPKKINKLVNKTAKEKSRFEREINLKSRHLAINTPSYLSEKEDKIPIEERFIYTFLKNQDKFKEDDTASVTSEDFERFVLNKFESNFDHDLQKSIKNYKKKDLEDVDMSSDEEIDLDFEHDEDYNEAFKEFEDELDLKNQYTESAEMESENEDSESDSDDDSVSNKRSSFKRKGKNNDLMSLLASADEFSHLLQDNEDDDIKFAGDLEDIDDDDDDSDEDDDGLDFDDDDETLEKRKNRSTKRKEKEFKDSEILRKKISKKTKNSKIKNKKNFKNSKRNNFKSKKQKSKKM